MSRYEKLFESLGDEGAFVPFIMLSDPSPEVALEVVRTVIHAGADALELGVPFSDPVADGPVIQRSHARAIDHGATVDGALEQIAAIRTEFPDIPIGMLVYGNVAFARGFEQFYRDFGDAGADSILIPDVPVREGAPFIAAAEAAGVEPIFIAPAQASADTLRAVAENSRGYIYAISRDGVTGTEHESDTSGLSDAVSQVAAFGGPPILLGFGISRPEHVADAIAAGAAGAITGSAITRIIEDNIDGDLSSMTAKLTDFVSDMKNATRKN